MTKNLKLAFAMGGGVSLGTFSGAALSEAIKQAVLHGGYKNEHDVFTPYNKIIIDVFSGASAGSMSLAIMLRGLTHQTQIEREHAELTLTKEIEGFNLLEKEKRENLIVAQVVKDLQKKIWAEEINIEKLLGISLSEQAELTYEGGLLRRGALEEIAKQYFSFEEEVFESNFSKRRLLADEVVFASTLSNITALKHDCRDGDVTTNPNYAGSEDAFTSYVHQELRVFHLFFDKVTPEEIRKRPEEYPKRWLRYHTAGKVEGSVGSLKSKTAWARIVATSISCGAFPFAFEPVVLERFKFEYDKNVWPKELTPEVCALATGATSPLKESELSYPFSYVDGGVFNNEPVREAFRLASFLDAEDTSDFDRVIVFVDPNVSEKPINFRVPVHQAYTVKEPRKILGALDGFDLIKKTSLDKILPHIGSIITMIVDEGGVNESDKIHYITSLFKKKEEYYELIYDLTANMKPTQQLVDKIKKKLIEILNAEQLNSLVPRGSLTLKGELIRIRKEQGSRLGNITNEDINAFLAEGSLANVPKEIQLSLLNALYIILLDLLMDLSGKSDENKIIAIAPVVRDNSNGKLRRLDLPGRFLYGFAGFTSPKSNKHAIECADFCTRVLMKELQIIPEDIHIGSEPVWNRQDEQEILQDFKSKLLLINARIDNLLMNSHVVDYIQVIDKFLLTKVGQFIKNKLAEIEFEVNPSWSFLFMVEVQDKKFELDGAGVFNDTAPVRVDGKLFLITELKFHYNNDQPDKSYWNGKHVQNGKLLIDHDGFAVLPDKSYCKIDLPNLQVVKVANLMPNPIFEYRLLTESDEGKNLSETEWRIKPGVKLIEKHLL